MALADPQSLSINGTNVSLPRIKTEGTASTYRSADENDTLVVSHQVTGQNRQRHLVKETSRKVAADPLTAQTAFVELGISIVIDEPPFGFTHTEVDHRVQALKAWLTTANVLKVLEEQH